MTNSTGTTVFNQGEIWLCKVYFKDLDEYKLRPIAIVSQDKAIDIDIVVVPITTQAARNEYDVELKHWKEAGLAKPSFVRTSKLITIHGSVPKRKLGTLHTDDLQNVIKACKEVF